ncbi:MAG: 3'(2'),5'-bisphosphate nucleotidase CysQ [Desulfobacterales bacterium]|jgi:3'(2'), 5'-bisphosphate nucleotidase
MKELLISAIDAGIQAGNAILAVYETDFQVEHKSDHSPLTLADQKSHRILVDQLADHRLPVLSEEGRHLPFEERKRWPSFWLLDPLDGTKEFVKRNGEFTVNIALIEKQAPVLGVIYVPVGDMLYFGTTAEGAYKLERAQAAWKEIQNGPADIDGRLQRLVQRSLKLPHAASTPAVFTIVGSRSHSTPEVDDIKREMQRRHGEVALVSAGSSLKLCMVAEGRAHLYPRTGPTMEWDTAAGQAIAQAAGARVVEFGTDQPLLYNKENLRNPWFEVKTT